MNRTALNRTRANDWFWSTVGFAGTGLAAVAIIGVLAWLITPRMASPSSVAALEPASLEQHMAPFDSTQPAILWRQVDYSMGPAAPWYPKGESPILAQLVQSGQLPPVAERVGPEPLVLRPTEQIGTYGGTWLRAAISPADVRGIAGSLSGANLVRWSPQGYPLVPHIAKGWDTSADRTEWTLYLREGMRWSDGTPFTAGDIVYWWEYDIKALDAEVPAFMKIQGEAGEIKQVDDTTVRFVFPHPFGLFLETLTNADDFASPRHYLAPFHPALGDSGLIEQTMHDRRVTTPRGLYANLKHWSNPEHPRLWPWIYRTYKASPPQSFVRNPYYFAVDEEGNQLPYVDRVTYELVAPKLIANAATGGRLTMQARHIRFDDYTLLMAERDRGNYDVYHWYPGSRAEWALFPNLNRRVEPGDAIAGMKHALLNERDFRIALSVAIDRWEIIEAEYHGIGTPAQIAPGPDSPFHHQGLLESHTQYNPELAGRLFDRLGLDRRDAEGMRTFPDGSRMTWYLNYTDSIRPGPVEFVITHWAQVGVRAVAREVSRPLFAAEKAARMHDFSIWQSNSEFLPLVQPRSFVPVYSESHQAQGFGIWYQLGGLYGMVADGERGAVEPPPDHPLRRAMVVLDAARQARDIDEQVRIFREVLDINAEHCFTIGISTPPPQPVVVKRGFRNVPRHAIISGAFSMPAHAGAETFSFEHPDDSPSALDQLRQELVEIALPPSLSGDRSGVQGFTGHLAVLVRTLLLLLVVLALVLIGVRHPYTGRRLFIMVPTLLLTSVVVFAIVQAPPSDFVQTKILQASLTQDPKLIDEVKQIREIFPIDAPLAAQYGRWLGLKWFVTFNSADAGLLQGNLGRSMETRRPVNEMVEDRIVLTLAISAGTILFTWLLALPIGIYSAVRQYSLADYVLTTVGFIGMCVPGFLLALILLFVGQRVFGTDLTGLFSAEFAAQLG